MAKKTFANNTKTANFKVKAKKKGKGGKRRRLTDAQKKSIESGGSGKVVSTFDF